MTCDAKPVQHLSLHLDLSPSALSCAGNHASPKPETLDSNEHVMRSHGVDLAIGILSYMPTALVVWT